MSCAPIELRSTMNIRRKLADFRRKLLFFLLKQGSCTAKFPLGPWTMLPLIAGEASIRRGPATAQIPG